MQYGKLTSNNLFPNESLGTASGQLAAFLDWNKRGVILSAGTVLLWVRRSRQRSELRQVLGRDDRFFLDIGVSRATLHQESQKWFWQG